MKYFKLLAVILYYSMCYITRVKSQETTDAADESGAPKATTTTPAPLVSPDVAEYLNGRIRQVLRENPEKDATVLTLATVFNEKRDRLQDAVIRDPAEKDDDLKAEEALESFRNFMQQYNEVAGRLENAIDDLTDLEEDPNIPVELRYEALMLLLRLRDSANIRDAEKAIRLYEDFRQRLSGGSQPGPDGVKPPAVAPPLSDEYRRYFEEILKILKKYIKADDPKMQTLLQQLLQNPEELKKLAAALRGLSKEDYDDEDYLWDLFSFW